MSSLARTRSRGPVAAVALALLLVLGATGASEAAGFYPTLSLGNRGSDVRALQELLIARGQEVPVNGVFDESTQVAVQAYQAARGLNETGTVDTPTWKALTPSLKRGSRGAGVRAVQILLNEKRRAGLAVDGVYRASTQRAVSAFQKHMRANVTGTMNEATWRSLVWHYELPAWNRGLCDYSVGNGTANWGTGEAVGQLEAAARRTANAGYGRVALGDIGHERGGAIRGHESHRLGLDVDVRPMRDNRDQCRWGTSFRLSSYNRKATRALIKAIRAAAPGHVKVIYFNDPVLIKEGLTTWYVGHDDHLHVRYCETAHPVRSYRCRAQTPAEAGVTGPGASASDVAPVVVALLQTTVRFVQRMMAL